MTGSEVGDREDPGAGTQIRDTWSTMTLYVAMLPAMQSAPTGVNILTTSLVSPKPLSQAYRTRMKTLLLHPLTMPELLVTQLLLNNMFRNYLVYILEPLEILAVKVSYN